MTKIEKKRFFSRTNCGTMEGLISQEVSNFQQNVKPVLNQSRVATDLPKPRILVMMLKN